jgi:hypothetical protein
MSEEKKSYSITVTQPGEGETISLPVYGVGVLMPGTVTVELNKSEAETVKAQAKKQQRLTVALTRE